MKRLLSRCAVLGGIAMMLTSVVGPTTWATPSRHVTVSGSGSGVAATAPHRPPQVTALAAGNCSSLALEGGGVRAWGGNPHVNLVPSDARSGVSRIAAHGNRALALKDGKVISWGMPSPWSDEVPEAARSGVTAIAAGWYHNLAVKNGGVIGWGNKKALGTIPKAARSGITLVAGGAFHSLALTRDGKVIAWDVDNAPQVRVPKAARSGVDAIAAGYNFSLALKDGRVIAWGHNRFGQVEVPEAATSNVVAIAAGSFFAVAVTTTGKVIVWGDDRDSQMVTIIPARAAAGVTRIAAGGRHVLGLDDGHVIAWGSAILLCLEVPPGLR